MKKILIDYLLYGLLFGLLTTFAFRRREHASRLLLAGLLLFWLSFFTQVFGMLLLTYVFPGSDAFMTLFIITTAGMFTSVFMMIHALLYGKRQQ